MVGLTGRGRAAQNVIDLGEQGLSDGDDISPYIDQYWTDGNEVHIPAGDYHFDGSGLHGKRGNCSLIGSEEGVQFFRPDDDSQVRPTIQCTHGTMRIENITVRGASPSSANTNGSRWRFDALDPDSRIEVVNVNHPDGSTDNSDSNAFLTYEDHYGTLHFKNCYVANFGNSAFYVNLGYKSGVENPVIVENCTIINANGAIRGGHNGTKYIDCTFVWREEPRTWVNGSSLGRGIRWDHGGENELVQNCHFYFGGDIGSTGGSLEFEDYPISGEVRDVYIHTEGNYGGIYDKGGMGGWTFENVNVTGPGSAAIDADVSVGDTPPDLRNENAVWMPESQTVRPQGGSSSGGSGGTDEPEGSMFEVVATDDAELEYAFDVDGTAEKAEASQDNSSLGEANDTITDNGDGTVTVEGKTGFGLGDAFRVDGEVLSFERVAGDSGVQLLLDGEDVTDQYVSEEEDPSSMFEIVSTDDDASLDYTFTVEGSVEKAEASQDNSSLGEANDTITDNGDGTVTVEGRTGLGLGDAFLVTGAISSFERVAGDSGVQLLLDGEDVTDQFVDEGDEGDAASMFEIVSTDGDAELEYAFDVDGTAEKAEASQDNSSLGEANDTITDNGDGTVTVEGKTGMGYGDAFLVTGPISNFERTSGNSGFALYLDGTDVTEELAPGPQRVFVDGTTAPEEVNAYSIEVTGDIEPDPENTTLVDGGLAWDSLEDSVDGSTAVGVVGNGVDAYVYTGEIVDLTVDGNATTRVED